jgi:chromosomal replication initiation ATPase DnaA
MKQLIFDFRFSDDYSISNFIVFPGNLEAFCVLSRTVEEEREGKLDKQIIFLSGEKKSGKTHLSCIWKQHHDAKIIDLDEARGLSFEDFVQSLGSSLEKFGYYIIDNFPMNIADDKFLYLLNTLLLNNSSVLLISEFDMQRRLNFDSKDLESRIRASTFLSIGKLTDDIKPMLIGKLFADRQILVSGGAMSYLNDRTGTNYREVVSSVNLVCDRLLAGDRQRLSLSFLKGII